MHKEQAKLPSRKWSAPKVVRGVLKPPVLPTAAELLTCLNTQSRLLKEEYITCPEMMRLFHVRHKTTIYEFIKRGMPHLRVGRDYRFNPQEVIEFLKMNREKVE